VNVRDSGRRDAEPMAVFPRRGEYVAFSIDSIRSELQLAWATTVHKAQGSEFDHVCVVLPDECIPLLTCEVLYTAVSRSRRSVVLVGDEVVLADGVRAVIERFSGVAEGLAGGRP
jgi:exodeoxyribonuclease V alpha subunit